MFCERPCWKDGKPSYREKEIICKPHIWQKARVKNSQKLNILTKTAQLENWQKKKKKHRDVSQKNMYRWQINLKRYLVSLAVRGTQMKTTIKYHCVPIRMIIIKNSGSIKCCWACREKVSLIYCCWEFKMTQPLWKTLWQFL